MIYVRLTQNARSQQLLLRSLSVLMMLWSRLLKRHESWKSSCEEWIFEIKKIQSLNESEIRNMIRWSERIKKALIDIAIRRKFCCPSSFLSPVSVWSIVRIQWCRKIRHQLMHLIIKMSSSWMRVFYVFYDQPIRLILTLSSRANDEWSVKQFEKKHLEVELQWRRLERRAESRS